MQIGNGLRYYLVVLRKCRIHYLLGNIETCVQDLGFRIRSCCWSYLTHTSPRPQLTNIAFENNFTWGNTKQDINQISGQILIMLALSTINILLSKKCLIRIHWLWDVLSPLTVKYVWRIQKKHFKISSNNIKTETIRARTVYFDKKKLSHIHISCS